MIRAVVYNINVDDGFFQNVPYILHFLLSWIGVVKPHVRYTVVCFCHTKVEADGFRVAQMKISIGLCELSQGGVSERLEEGMSRDGNL